MFVGTLFVQALLAVSALAFPSSRERFERRAATRNGKPRPLLSHSNATHDTYDETWAGGIISSNAGTYKSVVGTFTAPPLSVPPGSSSSGEYATSAWVGIDGATCQTAIWQAGIDMYIKDGSASYYPWYEWYPAGSVYYDDLTVSEGDSLTVNVTATSTTTGTVTIKNNSNGQSKSSTVSYNYPLCEQDAEWIVEDFYYGDSTVHLVDWNTVAFTDAVAKTSSKSVAPTSGYTYDLEQSGKILSSTTLGSSTVTIKYV
ncbi:hypothetical protein PHLGIDRAFT_101361 [Phlebiopsis gigantea 11061_1 CR5-6]|uniref:Aspergillopepsin n=1 Tax=Phlebiopsis gigantea (strain 11061_1 CR5-6) TaxID=745531 RepID=A0A0C3SBS1_PHLG1|nr:hypothetical protein PHLGIDRAFT_101361 [Phlebiopsis gigantea 11061_1 CR5-6]